MGFDTLDRNGALKVANSLGSFTVTTTGNIDDLDFNNAALIRMNNATLSTIRGLKAGVDGQEVTIVSIGAGNVEFANQNASSGAANRLINIATSANTPIAAGAGSLIYRYDLITARWRLITHNQGASITATYSAGNFTGSGAMTWTVDAGDVDLLTYRLVSNVLTITWVLITTSVGGVADTYLRIGNGAWGGFLSTFMIGFYLASPTGAASNLAVLQASTGGDKLLLASDVPGTSWTSPTVNVTQLIGSISFPVQ